MQWGYRPKPEMLRNASSARYVFALYVDNVLNNLGTSVAGQSPINNARNLLRPIFAPAASIGRASPLAEKPTAIAISISNQRARHLFIIAEVNINISSATQRLAASYRGQNHICFG